MQSQPDESDLGVHGSQQKKRASSHVGNKQRNRRFFSNESTDAVAVDDVSNKRKRTEEPEFDPESEPVDKRNRGGAVASSVPTTDLSMTGSAAALPASSHKTHQQQITSTRLPPPGLGSLYGESLYAHDTESTGHESVYISSQQVLSEPDTTSARPSSPRAAESSNAASESSAIATTSSSPGDEQCTTISQPAPPPQVATVTKSTGPYIDTRGMNFGLLVPFNDSAIELPAISLYLPYNRFGQKTLTVGSSENADIKLQGDGIGPIHCCLNLILRQPSWSSYERIVEVNRSSLGGWVTTVNRTSTSEPSVDSPNVLKPGAVVVFAAGSLHKYRYVPPEPEVDFHWLKANFTWSEELQPASGPEQPDDYSALYFVRTRDESNTEVVLKMISTLRPHSVRLAHREREVLQLLDHENTIQLLAYQEDIIERTIRRRVGLSEQLHLSETVAPWVAKGLLSALKFLHARQVVHRNIKPENVFLADEWSDDDPPRIVLADFALSRLPGEGHFQAAS
ncbi:hypothetical protein FRB90_007408 [Tulasnella sp. 427]|nr:hypothetical protein FRB90_007408 [Tulasnella sp. 427]